MKPALVDTDIISYFFKNYQNVVLNVNNCLNKYGVINFSIISYYEILSGLQHRDAIKQMNFFLDFAQQSNILPLTKESVTISADLYAYTRKSGIPVDDIDILIAGVALSNNLAFVTNNECHFSNFKRANTL